MSGTALPPQLSVLTEPAQLVLTELFADRISSTQGSPYQQLWIALRDATMGGKLVRPLLVMITATGGNLEANPELTRQAAYTGAAFELLHSGFLIHDDIMDRDSIRRGSPTVVARFRTLAEKKGSTESDHLGESAAIIVGDLALTGAYRLLAFCENKTSALIDILDEAIQLTAEGQLIDVSASDSLNLSVEDLLDLAYLKTGAYSFVSPLESGMLLANWPEQATRQVKAAGKKLGIAFQLYDDILGVSGDVALTGKPNDSDLASRKQTLITHFASQHPDWSRVWNDLGQNAGADSLRQAREILAETDAIAQTQKIAHDLHSQAYSSFRAEEVPKAAGKLLIMLAQWLEGRSR